MRDKFVNLYYHLLLLPETNLGFMHISCPQKADKKLTLQSSHLHVPWKPTTLPSLFFVDAAR